MNSYHIHIKGIVQGVGFRPHVYKMAVKMGLTGWVNNTSDGVHIEFNADEDKAKHFLEELLAQPPEMAVITSHSFEAVARNDFRDFKIIRSEGSGGNDLLLTPDFAMCSDCKQELYDSENKRFGYPFITCTNCGPRYSIINKLPYDRPYTTMDSFKMCPSCQKEYDDPLDRRYYSQTNSCPDCKVSLFIWENGQTIEADDQLDRVIAYWKAGKIVAIKGIGGYLLTCDATNAEAIGLLRKRKNRPSKPLALMYHDLYELAEDVEIDISQKMELESPAAPIVLLNIKSDRMTPIAVDEIAPKLNQLGVMLPYAPLYDLLLNKFGKPIVATSGNRSQAAIVYDDDKAQEELSEIADLILFNDRDIVIPQDDSVVRYSTLKYQRILIRRSRGLAPSFIQEGLQLPQSTILAMGAMLKSTFTLLNRRNVIVSPYLGNTDHYEAELNYKKTIQHIRSLYTDPLDVILVDAHPGYPTTRSGKELGLDEKVEVHQIQHHEAHLFAVLAENELLESDEKILGVIWDGTGLGSDGQIWGGEFFEYHEGKVDRIGHIDYFDFILGDKMPKEPRISALAIGHDIEEAGALLETKFTPTEWQIYKQLLQREGGLKSSSVGRLFDALACIILDIDKHSYHGEAAMLLENAAASYLKGSRPVKYYSYLKDIELPEYFPKFLVKKVIEDLEKDFDKDFIAAKVHITLGDYIHQIAQKYEYKHIAFSGGVFQNAWLTDILINFMENDYQLYFHKQLSPNDENISFGQLMHYIHCKA